MSVDLDQNRIIYTGNGVTLPFTVPFYFLADADLVVYLVEIATTTETLQVITTNYTVTGAGDEAGGTVTFLIAPPATHKVVIFRNPDRLQGLELGNASSIPVADVVEAFDKNAMQAQRLFEEMARCVRLSPANTTAFDCTFPSTLTAGKTIAINATGDGLAEGPDGADIAAAAGNAVAAAASAAAASSSASSASGSASAASASASAASGSASAASSSASAAATSASTAGSAAATATASKLFSTVVFKTTSFTVTSGDNGTLFVCDATTGAIVVTLPTIAGLTLPYQIGVVKSDATANAVTPTRASTDTINGATTFGITVQNAGAILAASTTPSPDQWALVSLAPVGALTVQANDADVDTAVRTVDFSTAFTVTSSPAGEANVALASNGHAVGALAFTATDKIAGRSTAGAGGGEEIACTAAGRALLDDANAAAQLTTLGVTAAAQTVLDDTTVAAMRTTLGAYGRVAQQVFTGSGTYTPTSGMLHAIIECVGGGGGGGGVAGAATVTIGAGGGGAGGYSRKLVTAADIGASKTVTIGAAGSAGASGANNGGAGGDTSVGVLCVGKGGSGGLGGSNSVLGDGGAGGVAGTGDVTATGARGVAGFYLTAGNLVVGGNGASSQFGGGGSGGSLYGTGTEAGAAGAGFGSGGGGGLTVATASNIGGGAGTAGIVIITEFLPQ